MLKKRIFKNLLKYGSKTSILNILFNSKIEDIILDGLTIDLGSFRNPRPYYHKLLKNFATESIVTVDIMGNKKPHIMADLEIGLPFRNNSCKHVLIFNVLEHIYNYNILCSEVYRILRSGGACYIFTPFLHRIHNDPCDYFRYSGTALHHILRNAGFDNIYVECLGFGPTTVAWNFLRIYFSFSSIFKFSHSMLFHLCLKIDELIERKNRSLPLIFPFAYLAKAQKLKYVKDVI